MTTEANKAIVRRFFEDAWNQNKVSDLDEYIAADTVHHFGARIAKQGPNELRAVIKNWRGAMPDYRCYIEDMIAEGDRVAPSNRRIDDSEILIMRVDGGKIVESWATWDRLSVLEQLGAIAKPTKV